MSIVKKEFRFLTDFLKDDAAYAEPIRTAEDKEVWSRIVRHLEMLWKAEDKRFFTDYLLGLERLKISASRIPVLSKINLMLSQIGWSAVYVDGMVDDHLYHEMQAARIFPVARKLRRLRDLDHSAAPDFAHDVLGHLPMLFTAHYRSIVREWGQLAMVAPREALDVEISKSLAALIAEHENGVLDAAMIGKKTDELEELHRRARNGSPSLAARFARFYAWAIEFGIIADGNDTLQVSGSAALSSPGELRKLFNGETQLVSFVDHALDTPVDYTTPQSTMFFVNHFSEYRRVLRNISRDDRMRPHLSNRDPARSRVGDIPAGI
jgi:phenylalanine-4-hydroxylase